MAFQRLADRLAVLLAVVLAVLLAFLVLLATAETVAWALFERSAAATEEIAGILEVWLALLGAALLVRQGLHLKLEAATDGLAAPKRRALDRLAALLVALFGALLARYGFELAASVTNTLPATGWRASAQYFPAGVAGVLIAFFAVAELFRPASTDAMGAPAT